jgi:hypothetical protein
MRWQVLVFGWPGAAVCLLLTIVGLFFRRPAFVAIATAFGLGFDAYLFKAMPPLGALLLASQLGCIVALRAHRPVLAYLAALPTVALMAVPVGLALR